MKLTFLGTGAADWNGPDARGEYRRLTSTLIDGSLLIDVTHTVDDMIENPAAITDVLFTHSHDDHFDLDALRSLAPVRVYAHESWAGEIAGEGLTVVPLRIGVSVQAGAFTVTPMPSNHSTGKDYETTLHYLIEKNGQTLLYATDGAWLLNREHKIIGKRTLDAVVFDATIGDSAPGDFRIFEHNSIDMVRLMTATMLKTGRLRENAPVYLTHMARTLHAPQKQLEAELKAPFIPCYDGMKAAF